MTTAEAAQKWAEAKETLDKAAAALQEAEQAHRVAENAEQTAWLALRELSGRPAQAVERHLTPPPEPSQQRIKADRPLTEYEARYAAAKKAGIIG